MSVLKIKFATKNPFKDDSDRIKSLDNAYKRIVELLDEYCALEDIPNETKINLKEIIARAYTQKKMQYFIDDKIDEVFNKVNSVVQKNANYCVYGDADLGIQKDKKDMFYVNKIKHTVYG